MRCDVISFDLDGTLVDTAAEIAEAANRTLADFGVAPQPLSLISTFIGAGTRQMMLRLIEHLHRQNVVVPRDAALERLDHHHGDVAGSVGRPYAGCDEALSCLRGAGLRLACLTNKEHRFAEQVLHGTRLRGHFELVIGGDTLPHRKPHPSTMGHVLQVLQCAPHRAAHVGDSRIDVETARQAGVAAWAVPWGYNGSEPIAAAGPDCVFFSFAELAAHALGTNDDDLRLSSHNSL